MLDLGPPSLRRGAETEKSYPASLQTLLRKKLLHSRIFIEAAGAGELSAAVDRLKAETAGEPPDFVIWRPGADDIPRNTPTASFIAGLRQGVSILRASGVEVAMVGLSAETGGEPNPGRDLIARAISQVAREEGAPFVDRSDPVLAMILAKAGDDPAGEGTRIPVEPSEKCLADQIGRAVIEGVRAVR